MLKNDVLSFFNLALGENLVSALLHSSSTIVLDECRYIHVPESYYRET